MRLRVIIKGVVDSGVKGCVDRQCDAFEYITLRNAMERLGIER